MFLKNNSISKTLFTTEGLLDEANVKYYQADYNQPRNNPSDLCLFLRAYGLDTFKIEEYPDFGLVLIKTPKAYNIHPLIISRLLSNLPVSLGIYFELSKDIPHLSCSYEVISKGTMLSDKSRFKLPVEWYNLIELQNLPKSVKFLMED